MWMFTHNCKQLLFKNLTKIHKSVFLLWFIAGAFPWSHIDIMTFFLKKTQTNKKNNIIIIIGAPSVGNVTCH